MSLTNDQINRFNNSRVKATVINLKCVEDIDDIRIHLQTKYGEVTEDDQCFFANGKRYMKPWLPKERIGVFRVRENQYYIEAESSSAKGRLTPRRSFFSLDKVQYKDENTLVVTIDSVNDGVIEYTLID